LEVARSIVNALEEKKGENIVLIEIQEISSFADYFVICSGTSERMLDALAEETAQNAKKNFQINGRIEGIASSGWMVIDLGDVVVHLFTPEQRDYYLLEELWSRGKIMLRVH
jgi:ribosome-associated protein